MDKQIVDYYRRSAWLYKYFWYSPKSLGMHYGFWDKNTKTKDESIINQYKYVIEMAEIKKGMRVLDAGCGVGGAAIYMAQMTGAKVTGITITPEQVTEAKKNAKAVGVNNLTDFQLQDYTKTDFPNEFFDVAFGIESVCYAYPKRVFLDEAYRILKPGGTLVITDGYCKRELKNEEEEAIIRKFCEGWRLRELAIFSDMTKYVKQAGFKGVKTEDLTEKIKYSLKAMQKLIYVAKPATYLSRILPFPVLKNISDNVQSMQASIDGVGKGLGGYYSHIAKK